MVNQSVFNVANAWSCLPEGITFTSRAQIDSFQINYPNCTELEGDVTIHGSDIYNLNGLNVLTSISGDLDILWNHALTSLMGLDNLDSIGGDFYIWNNTILTSLTGLEGLHNIGGALRIGWQDHNWFYGNPSLINLTGLNNIITIGGELYICYNESLTSLLGLDSLTSIGGGLTIANPALTSLSGLDNLTSIGGDISINDNTLKSLTGLENVEANTISNLYIYNNPFLSTCAVQSICDYLASPNGSIDIYSNATGCNSPAEVDSACIYLSTDEINIQHVFSIYPNPSSTTITIETPTKPEKNTFLTIYNINGQALLSRQITEQQTVVDVTRLVQGVYFVRVSNDATVMVGKFVKQ